MKYILYVSDRNFLSNDNFTVFNTYLTWISWTLKKFDEKLNFNLFNADFEFMHQWTVYEIRTKCMQNNFL